MKKFLLCTGLALLLFSSKSKITSPSENKTGFDFNSNYEVVPLVDKIYPGG